MHDDAANTPANVTKRSGRPRSVPRARRLAGDLSRDGRGRFLTAPPILHYGFRPFFFAAALDAGVAIPLWLWLYQSGAAMAGPFAGLDWHVHEMMFGYLAAVIAGFVLTAVPNWTGRLPLSGGPLAGLVSLWVAGRLACAFVADPLPATLVDLAFPVTLAGVIWREVAAGRNWRNAPVAGLLTLFALANAGHHAETLGLAVGAVSVRLALGAAALMIALIGGRIVPSFTRNWLVKAGSDRLPASLGRIDRIALVAVAAALALWIVLPQFPTTGLALLAAGGLLALRLSRWRGLATAGEPILLVLHLGYAWLAAALALLGAAILFPESVPQAAAVHTLTAGAIGTMTLAMMTRVSLGHTGRAILADRWTVAIYAAVILGALLRVAAAFLSSSYLPLLMAGGALWSAAFLLFAIRYGPILWGPRAGTRRAPAAQ